MLSSYFEGNISANLVQPHNITRQITGVAAGKEDTDVVNVAQLKAVASQITTQAVATTPLKVGDGNNGNPAGKVIAPIPADANKLATAGDIANAINNSGFQATAGGNLASGTTATATTVKPGQKVTFAAGNGLTVKQDVDGTNGNQTYTYAVDAQTVVQNAQTPVVYTKADGTKVYKRPDGKFYDAPTGGNEVAAGDVIASMQNAAGNTTAPTTLANVKAGVKPTDAVNVSQLKGAADALGGGAGIADGSDPAVPAGTFIKPSYTITKTDGTTYAPANNVGDALSNLNAEVIKPLTFAGDSGTNVERKLGSTLNVKGGATGALTEGNIGVVADAVNNTLNLKLAQNIDLGSNGSVKTGATKMDNNGITIAAPTPTDPANTVSLTSGGLNNGGNKITNVAAGADPNDAVNLSQLQAMGSAAKTHYYSVNSNQQAAGSNYNNDGATGTDALAAGVKAQAAQRNSIAIGNEAKVENSPANPSSSSIAIGDKAKAQGDLALAIGPGATVSGESAAGGIAIGSAATSNNGGMAVGSGANAGNGTPMIPGLPVRLNNNVALGDSALVKDDTNFRVALGSFSIAGESDLTAAPYKPTANANVAGIAGSGVELGEVSVGGDNTAGMGKTLYRRVTNVAAGAADTDAVNVSQLKAAQAAATSKVAAGNGISVTPTVDTTTGSTTYTVAADTTALNVGDGNNGNPAGKVITPTGADANKLATAGDIANAINNSGFNITAGGNTVGNAPVATTAKPGSTLTLKAGDGLTVKQDLDANGNQSYTYALNAQSVVQNAQTPVVYTKADGSKVYKHSDGKFYDAPEGQPGAQQVQPGDVIASMQNAAGNTTDPTTLANVKSNLADTTNAVNNPAGNDRATLAAGNKGNNAATVNDVLNAGFTVQGNGQNKDFVTHGDTINFADGQGTVAKVTSAGGVTKVQFDTPMTYVDPAGNPTSTPSNKVNLVGGNAGAPVTLDNVADGTVAANSKEAINGGQLHDLKENGFKISDGTNTDTVKLTETVKYTGDGNIVTTVTDNQVGFKLADSITVGPATGGHPVNIDGNAGTVTGLTNKTWNPASITSGRAATEDQLKAAQAAATSKVAAGNGISVTPTVDTTTGSTTYTVAADTTALNVGDGNNGNPAGKVITPTGADANKLATAGDIANAINNSGFNITAGGNTVGNAPVATTAKPGSTLTLKAGDGLTVKQDLDANGNQSYTYALNAQSVVQNAQTPVVYTKADGSKVYKHSDGKFYDAPEGQPGAQQVQPGDVIASMQNAAGNTTDPTTLANVKSNLADTTNAVNNPAGNDRATLAAGNKGNNAATVNDVLNAGFTVQGNGQNKDFVTHGDTINFADGQGTVAKVTSAGGVTKVQFDTPMTYVDPAGNPTSTPSNKVNLVGDAAGGPVTLGNVAPGTLSATSTEAVNGSQLYATNQNVAKGINFGGTTGSNNYQLGDTINVKGDNNITSTTVTGGAQLALNPNLSVTSVTTTDAAGNQTVTSGGGVTITPAGGGNPVSLTTGGLNNGGNKITNVADGAAGTDAVNVRQLNAALGALNNAGNANIAALDAKINDVADTANAGVAQAIATAGLPQAYLPGKNMVAVGGGYYKGETGYAVGFSTISDSGNWIIKATGSGNSRGNFGASIGAGYQW
ncbi:YadA-like family protein [Eikenella corrodens]|uniref:YadA-like family protein n=1 Tax=Eikenella corrodens TaxID=539 RepID=UPI00142F4283|nr:YadA-like family protein [Eikenella corrodens]